MTVPETLQLRLRHFQRRALLVGVVGAALCVLGYLLYPAQFFRSYLVAYMFWLGVVLGCLAILMLHHLVGGLWGMTIRRVLEAGTRLLPFMVVLFVPLLFGLPDLYAWARPGGVEDHATGQFRQLYLRLPFFLGRTGFYFVTWLVLVFFLNRWSRQQEQAADQAVVHSRIRRLGRLSSGGLVVSGLTITFAAVDWLMSLESQWFSTIYGLLIMSGQILGAMTFTVLVTVWLARDEPLASVISPGLLHDLGNLLLAFVLLWAYMAFSQLLINWSGDLPEEVHWYLHRWSGGWEWVQVGLLVLHFAVPFCVLLSRRAKRRTQWLAAIAAVIFGMRLLEVFWLVMPAFFPDRLHIHWLDFVAPAGIGGLWLAVFIWQLQRRSLLPWHEPRLQEVVQHG
jgi:hypothetical protein